MKKFEDREVEVWRSRQLRELAGAEEEQVRGVDEFEKNLQKLGIEQHISMDEAVRRQEEKQGIPPGQIQNFSYAATMNKIKESKKNTDFAGKERERRRRKMQVDQINAQAQLDGEKGQAALVAKLLAQNKHASEVAYAERRTAACKAMIFERRKTLAEARQLEKEAKDAVIA